MALTQGLILTGESTSTYLLVQPLGQPNVWICVDAPTQTHLYIIKQPSDDDVPPYPRFQHEMVMHELLKDVGSVRQQVDRIPPLGQGQPPRIVLEIMEGTLWEARRKRRMTMGEIRRVMKCVAEGLRDLEGRGLVYADLKMQNILLNGFTPEETGTQHATKPLTAKLGDLGIVMPPSKGLVQPIVYRAPEVYFRNEISPAADIWSFGLIYCQLLEAQASFHKYGIYDELLLQTSQVQKERNVERAIAHDFNLGGLRYYTDVQLPYQDKGRMEGAQWQGLREKGVPEKEIRFLMWVLDPVPTERPTAQEILNSGWLDDEADAAGGGGSAGMGAEERINQKLKIRHRNLHRKRSEPGLNGATDAVKGQSASRRFVQAEGSVEMQQQQPIHAALGNLGRQSQAPRQEQTQQQQQVPQQQQPRMSVNDAVLQSRAAPVLQRSNDPNVSAEEARPVTPRSNTGQVTGGTFMSYGAFMR